MRLPSLLLLSFLLFSSLSISMSEQQQQHQEGKDKSAATTPGINQNDATTESQVKIDASTLAAADSTAKLGNQQQVNEQAEQSSASEASEQASENAQERAQAKPFPYAKLSIPKGALDLGGGSFLAIPSWMLLSIFCLITAAVGFLVKRIFDTQAEKERKKAAKGLAREAKKAKSQSQKTETNTPATAAQINKPTQSRKID